MLPFVYIVGMPHSGSTLLAFLLNAHPEVISVGEFARIGDLLPSRWIQKSDLCSCGKTFYYCSFWNSVLAGYAARGYGLEASDFFANKDVEGELPGEKLKAFVEAVLDVTDTRVFVDASKFPIRVPALAQVEGLDFRIIDLYRDGRGVIHSWRKRLKTTPMKKVIQGWIKREKQRIAVMKDIPTERIFPLKYEELCMAPGEVLAKIFGFMGVDLDAKISLKFKSQVDHHIIGNPMRTRANEKIVLDEKWRRTLTQEELDLFKSVGGDEVNRQNGYAD
jgi:hypothetical protein